VSQPVMSDRDNLYRAILRDPDDDTVRLAYADYLDETAGAEKCPTCAGHGRIYQSELAGTGETAYTRLGGAIHRLGIGKEIVCTACDGGGNETHTAARADFIRVQVELEPLRAATDERDRQYRLYQREYRIWQRYLPTQADWDLPLGQFRSAWQPTVNDFTTASGAVAILRRGFVSEIRVPVEALCGWPCDECESRGEVRVTDAAGDADDMPCESCGGNLRGGYNRGTGRVGGLAKQLFSAHPITRVVLNGKSCTVSGVYPTARWHGNLFGGLPDRLPMALYRLVEVHPLAIGSRTGGLDPRTDFQSAADALTALSDACVRYGRGLAGLTNKEVR